tara:strand:+ start:11652 stop:12131 length:480 start_codon:yes stop_codon:yes gene_type:complete
VVKKQKYGEITKMKISGEGLALIKKFEGCELESYRCSANVVTIGYGHTRTAKEGMTITREEADMLLEEDIRSFETSVLSLVEVDLKQCEFDALIAWTFNLGAGNLKSSTLLKRINAKDWNDVPHQIKRWNKANGTVLQGLIRRREAEALLFQGKDWTEV